MRGAQAIPRSSVAEVWENIDRPVARVVDIDAAIERAKAMPKVQPKPTRDQVLAQRKKDREEQDRRFAKVRAEREERSIRAAQERLARKAATPKA